MSDTQEQFTAYYLQRATTELAEDLDKLRTAADFQAKATDANSTPVGPSSSSGTGAAATTASSASSAARTNDTPLQMLIDALRQGTTMFSEADQRRVVGSGKDQQQQQEEGR